MIEALGALQITCAEFGTKSPRETADLVRPEMLKAVFALDPNLEFSRFFEYSQEDRGTKMKTALLKGTLDSRFHPPDG